MIGAMRRGLAIATSLAALGAPAAAAGAQPAQATAQAAQAAQPAPFTAQAAQAVPSAQQVSARAVAPDTQRIKYSYGPIHVPSGGNLIMIGPVTIEKPSEDGYVTRIKPDLVRADGTVPNVDVIHLHHGVWLSTSQNGANGAGTPFFASGEEKSIFQLPAGFGYPVRRWEAWLMNHMVHNQTITPENVWITYEIDFVRASSPTGKRLKAARPVWMDVQAGSAYPVFDVKRRTGGRDRRFTYPDEARTDPYGSGRRLNEWTAKADGTLVFAVGHVHPGGLWTDLDLVRGTRARRVFRSEAKYWDPNGPVSWDMAMTATPASWRVGVKKGDRLRLSATYETRRASWYESMGIDLVYMAVGEKGPDPFRRRTRIATRGRVTHGHLPENENYGGEPTGMIDPRTLPDGQTLGREVGIAAFQYLPGNFGLPGSMQNPPVVEQGGSLRFHNLDWPAIGTMHSVTACAAPCTGSTGISYPLANGEVDFDSRNLGYGPTGFTAAANEEAWDTPKSLDPGTYSYFCRIHPFMRGAFRVKGKS
jgi:plastocyanin